MEPMCGFPEGMTWDSIYDDLDKNKDGMISFEEFKLMMAPQHA
jgi:hypothetical protein